MKKSQLAAEIRTEVLLELNGTGEHCVECHKNAHNLIDFLKLVSDNETVLALAPDEAVIDGYSIEVCDNETLFQDEEMMNRIIAESKNLEDFKNRVERLANNFLFDLEELEV